MNDGMDVSVCRFRLSKNELTFAGAKRPLYMFKNSELIEIKGNKFPIGSFQYSFDKLFSDHKIKLSKGDTMYLFSDGVQDQFGGADGKKFMISRFRNLLIEVQPLTMRQQAAILDERLTTWQGQMEQTDDMLLIGIRV
jgi:serine phosphatase RsbU (regulator of sigma subunit)